MSAVPQVDPGWAKPFFAGKAVLVTGGTSGIGHTIAAAFAGAGAKVTATGATAGEVAGAPGMEGLEYRPLDVRDQHGVADLVGEQERIDVLVNCAGINRQRAEHEIEPFLDVVDINLNGTMRVCAAAKPKIPAGGAVINLASMLSFFGAPHAPAYAASKGGVAQLTKSLAADWAPSGIRVNALAPGWIETGMTIPARSDPERNAAILSRTPMARWGQPEEVARVALFLASPLAGFVTGAIVPVDGGYLAR